MEVALRIISLSAIVDHWLSIYYTMKGCEGLPGASWAVDSIGNPPSGSLPDVIRQVQEVLCGEVTLEHLLPSMVSSLPLENNK